MNDPTTTTDTIPEEDLRRCFITEKVDHYSMFVEDRNAEPIRYILKTRLIGYFVHLRCIDHLSEKEALTSLNELRTQL